MTRGWAARFLAIALIVWPVAAQVPRDAASAPKPAAGSAVLGGRVTAAEGDRPVRLANIVVIGVTTGTLRVTSTDADGRFAVDALPADRYLVGASKPPLLGTMAGARRPARFGTPISVADGQRVTDVAIRMPKGAVITGVVTDDRGQPATCAVALQRRMPFGDLVYVQGVVNVTSVDEGGHYRFYGLPPGEYFVLAARPGLPPANTTAPTYFPGTTRASDAVPLTLAVGEERGDVDIRLESVRAALIEGIVTNDGPLPARMSVQLTSAASSPIQTARTVGTGPDGRFSFANIMPGSYTLIVNGGQPLFASTAIEVAGIDRTGVQLALRAALAISGRLEFEGNVAPPAAGFRVQIKNIPASAAVSPPAVTATNAQGVWTWTNVLPGRYAIGGPLYFGPNADSMKWALQSVTVNGRDVTDLPLEITADTSPTEIVVTYTDRWQSVSGRLLNPVGQAITDYTVVIFPTDEAYWIPGSRRILTAQPGTDGRYAFGGAGPLTLPAGAYRLAAVTDVGRDERYDPAFLRSLVPASVRVTVSPGGQITQDLIVR